MKLKKKDKKLTRNNEEPVYYNCDKIGHFKVDCFKKEKDDRARTKDAVKSKKKELYNKKGKRAMVATWSDEDDSSSESSGAKKVDLIADHKVTSSSSTSHSSDSRLSEDDELSYEELVEVLSQVCCKIKFVNKKKKILQKSFEYLLFKK